MSHLQLEPTSVEVQRCIEACLDCYDVCLQTEAHCLREGGRSAEVRHMKMLADCSRICQLAAEFMLRSSRFHAELCRLCGDICRLCAEDCRRFSKDEAMRECADVCDDCAEACRAIAG